MKVRSVGLSCFNDFDDAIHFSINLYYYKINVFQMGAGSSTMIMI